MKTFGLIGYPLGHSFSKSFFSEKFEKEGLANCQYLNFEIDSILKFPKIFESDNTISGLNCTIPYKQEIMAYMDEIDEVAAKIGAVNTIKPIKTLSGIRFKGFNTDAVGFENSLKPMLQEKHSHALILGGGGASKAVKYVLEKLGIDYISATRHANPEPGEILYADIDQEIMEHRLLIVNTTPLGTYPKVDACPNIPYNLITHDHLLYDLVYNPEKTLFLKKGEERGAAIKNGLEMLHGQAMASWKIWNSDF